MAGSKTTSEADGVACMITSRVGETRGPEPHDEGIDPTERSSGAPEPYAPIPGEVGRATQGRGIAEYLRSAGRGAGHPSLEMTFSENAPRCFLQLSGLPMSGTTTRSTPMSARRWTPSTSEA